MKEMDLIAFTNELAKIEIGCRISVQWPNNGRYYSATVVRERNTKDPFCVVYDNNEYEWIDFRQRKFRLLDSDVESSAESFPSDAADRLIQRSEEQYAIGTTVKKVSRPQNQQMLVLLVIYSIARSHLYFPVFRRVRLVFWRSRGLQGRPLSCPLRGRGN